MEFILPGIGIPEIIIILIALIIPIAIITMIVLYFRKNLKLKKEQIELLKKIANK